MMEVGFSQSVVLFAVYFAGGLACLGVFLRTYLWVTPYDDMQLIRSGNRAAATTLAGALIGYALPLARAIEQTYGPSDFLIWALVALVMQIAIFILIRKLFSNLVEQIENDRGGEAMVLAAASVAVGLINAAAMTS